MQNLKEKSNKKWVWFSDKNSRNNQIISILAIVETVAVVIFTWFIAIKYEIHHVIIAIGVAPLLLLKTKKSIDKGIELFFSEEININEKNLYADISLYMSAGIIFILSFTVIYLYTLLNSNSWLLVEIPVSLILVSLSIAIGEKLHYMFLGDIGKGKVIYSFIVQRIMLFLVCSVAGIVFGYIGNMNYIVLVVVLFLVGLSAFAYFFAAIIYKVLATVQCFFKNPIETLVNMPHNFREQIIVNDMFYTPELIPEMNKHHAMFTFDGVYRAFKNKTGIRKLFFIPLLFLWSLSYFYRWSIKSTTWFYFPLVYLFNIEKIYNKKEEERRITDQEWKVQLVFNAIIAIIVLINFNVIKSFEYGQVSIPVDQIKLLLNSVVNPFSLWLIVVSIGLYTIVFLFVSLQSHRKRNKTLRQNNLLSKLIHWIIRFKFTLWYTFFIWNIIFIWQKYNIWNIIFN
ncbi:MAG: hypothetical protein FE834_04635 [Gammaproteobacteria bacterium]|nr:hypothetical protein [Gammaproteobacteria bacterium]